MTTSGYVLTFSTTLELGEITNENINPEAQLFTQPMPGSSAADAIVLDLFGVQKTVKLNGTFIAGTGSKTVKQFIDQFVDASTGVINGNQVLGTYTSPKFTNNISVHIQSFSVDCGAGEPDVVRYTLQLLEGKSG